MIKNDPETCDECQAVVPTFQHCIWLCFELGEVSLCSSCRKIHNCDNYWKKEDPELLQRYRDHQVEEYNNNRELICENCKSNFHSRECKSCVQKLCHGCYISTHEDVTGFCFIDMHNSISRKNKQGLEFEV